MKCGGIEVPKGWGVTGKGAHLFPCLMDESNEVACKLNIDS